MVKYFPGMLQLLRTWCRRVPPEANCRCRREKNSCC